MNLRNKKLFLLDMDGTIYLGPKLFDGTIPFLDYVKSIHGTYLFLTNNSSRSADAYVNRLASMGIFSTPKDFWTSVDALIAYLKERPSYKLVYVFGTNSFKKQLIDAGIPVTDHLEEGIDCLICGFDTELTFQKLEDACILLGKDIDFLATNPDWVCPTSYGYVPDCGSVCEMLFRATGKRPIVIGKPQPDMVYAALAMTGYKKEEALMIGDRLYTDIASGYNAGIDTAFVLSGEGTMEDVEKSDFKPTYIFDDISALHKAILEK